VSHDFKTPINGMLGLVDAVMKYCVVITRSLQELDSEKQKNSCSIAAIGEKYHHEKTKNLDREKSPKVDKKSQKIGSSN
jgi:hypothetical protein